MILAFSGREHHAKKLMPVVKELRKSGVEVKWLIANNAINIDAPLEYMRPSGEPYIHAYFSLRPGDDGEIEKIVEDFLENNSSRTPSGVSPFWYHYSLREAAEVWIAFKRTFEQNDVKGVLVLHTNNFWAKPLAFLAQQKNIPVFAFQEGLLRSRDQETMAKQLRASEYCSKIFVWGQEAKKAYISAGAKTSQLVVSGPPHLDFYFSIKKDTVSDMLGKKPVVVFAPTTADEYIGDVGEDAKFIREAAVGLGFHFFFNPHPFERTFYESLMSKLNTIKEIDPFILAHSGMAVFVGQHSTVMIEALALGAVIVEYQKDGAEILQSLSKQGAGFSSSQETLFNLLNDLLSGQVSLEKKDLNRVVQGQVGTKLGEASGFIADRIKKEAKIV